MIWVGMDFKGHLIPTFLHWQEHLPLHYIAQSPIQPVLLWCWHFKEYCDLKKDVTWERYKSHMKINFIPNICKPLQLPLNAGKVVIPHQGSWKDHAEPEPRGNN